MTEFCKFTKCLDWKKMYSCGQGKTTNNELPLTNCLTYAVKSQFCKSLKLSSGNNDTLVYYKHILNHKHTYPDNDKNTSQDEKT